MTNKKINVEGTLISLKNNKSEDYVSLTDMAR